MDPIASANAEILLKTAAVKRKVIGTKYIHKQKKAAKVTVGSKKRKTGKMSKAEVLIYQRASEISKVGIFKTFLLNKYNGKESLVKNACMKLGIPIGKAKESSLIKRLGVWVQVKIICSQVDKCSEQQQ